MEARQLLRIGRRAKFLALIGFQCQSNECGSGKGSTREEEEEDDEEEIRGFTRAFNGTLLYGCITFMVLVRHYFWRINIQMNHIRGAFLYFHLQYVLFQNASAMVRFKRFENGNLYFFRPSCYPSFKKYKQTCHFWRAFIFRSPSKTRE